MYKVYENCTKQLHKDYHGVHKKIYDLQKELETVQGSLQSSMFNEELISRERDLCTRIDHWSHTHEQVLRQQSRQFGLKLEMLTPDDLLMFCRADNTSIQLLMEVFTEFSQASGLQANVEKSQIYITGVSDDTREDILQVTGFSIGTLPFRYLACHSQARSLLPSSAFHLWKKSLQRLNVGPQDSFLMGADFK